MSTPRVRHPDKFVPLTKAEFRDRFYARFYDPAFDAVQPELERVFEKAWDGYGVTYRKSPRTQPAGPGDRRPVSEAAGRVGADEGGDRGRGATAEGSGVANPHPPRQRFNAQPAHLSRAKSRKPCASCSMPGR